MAQEKSEGKVPVSEAGQEKKTVVVNLELFDKVPYTYINNSLTQGSNADVRIVFSEQFGSKIEPRLGIVMSHQHAKAFHEALGTTIARLERAAGRAIQTDLPHANEVT